MMDGTFVDSFRASLAAPGVHIVAGEERLIAPAGWQEITRIIPTIAPLKVHTLTAVVDYCKANVDALVWPNCLVHVQDPGTVAVWSRLDDEPNGFRRGCYLMASTALVASAPFPFGQYLDAETFYVGLQAGFLPSSSRDDALGLLASIREHQVRDTTDDGVAQEVKASRGVVLVAMTKVPNPVVLRPFRTFRELDQPASSFVLRLQSGKEGERPRCALFEADGGQWKLEAIQSAAAYLRAALGETITVLA